MKSPFTKRIQAFAKKHCKSKHGSTLIELIATVAILGILSTVCLSALYSVSSLFTKVNNTSLSQRTCALVQQNLAMYANSATMCKSYTRSTLPTVRGISSNEMQDCDDPNNTTKTPVCQYNDYIIRAKSDGVIEIAKFDATLSPNGFTTVTKLSDVKEIQFKVVQLSSSDGFILTYKITTTTDYVIDGGTVLNNYLAGVSYPSVDMTISTDASDSNYDNVLNITSTSRLNVTR